MRTLAPFDRRRGEVLAVEAVGAHTVLHCRDDGPDPRPGQFYMLATAEGWGGGEDERPYLPRAFSYLRRRPGALDFLLDDVGPGTHRLMGARPGEDLWLLGPLGAGFRPPAPGRAPLLVGGGIGIVPLAALQEDLGAARARALLGFRDARHAGAASLLEGAEVATDDGSAGHPGLVTELLSQRLGPDTELFACGPPAMLEAVRLISAEHGVPAQLALEAGMACGFGACFGCVVPTREGFARVCVDGPVFAAADLEAVPAH